MVLNLLCLYFGFHRWLVVGFKVEVSAVYIVTFKTELAESVENSGASGFDVKFIASCTVKASGIIDMPDAYMNCICEMYAKCMTGMIPVHLKYFVNNVSML